MDPRRFHVVVENLYRNASEKSESFLMARQQRGAHHVGRETGKGKPGITGDHDKRK